jgi:small subunit ribosomal protein S16
MVRIRFRRVGLKRQPSYRLIVTDKRNPRDGRFLEIIGHHNPRTEPTTDVIDEARALYWLSQGAQPSESVQRLMKRTGTWDRFERLRKGEDMDALVAEAEAAYAEQTINPQTSFASPADGQSKQKAKEAEAALATEAEAEAVAE